MTINRGKRREGKEKGPTEDQQGVGERAEDGEEEAADDPGAEDLEQQLAAGGEVGGGLEHEEAVGQGEEEVPPRRGRAREEPVRHLAPLLPGRPQRRRLLLLLLRWEAERCVGGGAPREPVWAEESAMGRDGGAHEGCEEDQDAARRRRRHGGETRAECNEFAA